jgi:hydroxylamine reductase (hybrid-cluster protein)
MGYKIELIGSDGQVLVSKHKIEYGSTHPLGGTTECSISVTYNYSVQFNKFFDKVKGIRWLNGKTGKESIPFLKEAVESLGTRKDKDYWLPSEGNAGFTLKILLGWAKEHPAGVWEVR